MSSNHHPLTMPENLILEVRDNIVIVTLDRPPVNALTVPLYLGFAEVFDRISAYAPGADCVILRSKGKNFCGGNDLDEFLTMNPENVEERMSAVRAAMSSIYHCEIPVVGAVQGVALGAGLGLAASCDLLVATHDASFGLPEISVGAMGGARHAMRLVPIGVVRRMHLTAEPVPASVLEHHGSVSELCDAERLEEVALRWARLIARHGPLAIRACKRSLTHVETYPELMSGYKYEQSLTGELSTTHDAKEAVRAFYERREPQYEGR